MPKPISASRTIAAPPEQVWELIAAPGNLEQCHPFCSANPVASWPGPASRDRVVYYNGRVVERRFTAWDEGGGYALEASDANGPAADVGWRLEQARDAGASRLTIGIVPRMLGGLPGPFLPVARLAVVRPMLRRYLRSVLKGIEFRVMTGVAVRRNQFGAHSWFSPKA